MDEEVINKLAEQTLREVFNLEDSYVFEESTDFDAAMAAIEDLNAAMDGGHIEEGPMLESGHLTNLMRAHDAHKLAWSPAYGEFGGYMRPLIALIPPGISVGSDPAGRVFYGCSSPSGVTLLFQRYADSATTVVLSKDSGTERERRIKSLRELRVLLVALGDITGFLSTLRKPAKPKEVDITSIDPHLVANATVVTEQFNGHTTTRAERVGDVNEKKKIVEDNDDPAPTTALSPISWSDTTKKMALAGVVGGVLLGAAYHFFRK